MQPMTPQEVLGVVEQNKAMLQAARRRSWEAAMMTELRDCNRLAALGDPEPLRRWCEAMKAGPPPEALE